MFGLQYFIDYFAAAPYTVAANFINFGVCGDLMRYAVYIIDLREREVFRLCKPFLRRERLQLQEWLESW